MPVTIDAYVYILIDANGDRQRAVVNEHNENIMLGGYDNCGKYQQFDSYEAYHLAAWAKPLGMTVKSFPVKIEVPE
jgi:hypothetical protein